MKTRFPIRKTDDKSTVIARDFSIFDAQIKSEGRFYFDDYKGIIDESKGDKTIIDDRKNPYDQTLPILVEIVREIGHDQKNLN